MIDKGQKTDVFFSVCSMLLWEETLFGLVWVHMHNNICKTTLRLEKFPMKDLPRCLLLPALASSPVSALSSAFPCIIKY